MPYIFRFQCLSRRFLKKVSAPANTMLDGKLFQLFITVSKKNEKMKKIAKRPTAIYFFFFFF